METSKENNPPPVSGWWLIPALFFSVLGCIALGKTVLFSAAGGFVAVFATTAWFCGAIYHMRIRSAAAGRVISCGQEEKFTKAAETICGLVFIILLLAPDAIPIAFWAGAIWYLLNIVLIR